MKNRFCYSYFSLWTNSGVISPEFRKAQAILLRVGSHSLILASCETSDIWPRGRDSENEPGLCSCWEKGRTERSMGNNGAAAGHSQHGAIFPVAYSSPLLRLSQSTLGLRRPRRKQLGPETSLHFKDCWKSGSKTVLRVVTLKFLVRDRRHCFYQARS